MTIARPGRETYGRQPHGFQPNRRRYSREVENPFRDHVALFDVASE